MKKTTFLPLMAASSCFLASCATKGPSTVTAKPPLVIPNRTSSTNWAVQDAPRTKPGSVMDPDAVTYAQVPKRIIYLPGEGGFFSRSSAQQEVAYDLVPVDRVPEIQARQTPGFEGKPSSGSSGNKISRATFPDEDGNLRKGSARRLGVSGKSFSEKTRAEAFLENKESLEWMPELGWVGFTETELIKVEQAQAPKIKIPDIDVGTTPEAPKIVKPDEPKPAPKRVSPGSDTPKESKPDKKTGNDNSDLIFDE